MGCFRLWSQDAVGGDRWVCCVWELCALAWLAEAVLEFGWAWESSSSSACCAARLVLTCCCGSCVLLCCLRAAVLLACSSRAAKGLWQQWLGVGEQSEGTQNAGRAAPSPSSLGRGRYLGSAKPQTLYSTRSESKAHLP